LTPFRFEALFSRDPRLGVGNRPRPSLKRLICESSECRFASARCIGLASFVSLIEFSWALVPMSPLSECASKVERFSPLSQDTRVRRRLVRLR